MAASSSDSDDLWSSEDEKENTNRTAVRRTKGTAAATSSPTVSALTARAAQQAEGLARHRKKHARLLRSHEAQRVELRSAQEELRQLRYAQPKLERELEVAHDTTMKAVDARRGDKAQLQKRLLEAEDAADRMAAQCGGDLRELSLRLQGFAATPEAAAPAVAQLIRDASRHTASLASSLGRDAVASELRHLCPGAAAAAVPTTSAGTASLSAPWRSAEPERDVAAAQPTAVDRDKAAMVALEQAELIQAYRMALLKERKRSAVLQRTAATAQEEKDALMQLVDSAGSAASAVERTDDAAERHHRDRDLERRAPLLAEVETLKQLAAEATAQAEEAIAAAKQPRRPPPPPQNLQVRPSKRTGWQQAGLNGMERVLARALSPAKAPQAAEPAARSVDPAAAWPPEEATQCYHSHQESTLLQDRLQQSANVIVAQQQRVAELEALVEDQKRDLQAALGMVIRRATPSPPSPQRSPADDYGQFAADGGGQALFCTPHGAAGQVAATPTASAAKWATDAGVRLEPLWEEAQ